MSEVLFSLNKFKMVVNGEFLKPLHRLIMLRVLHAGSFDGEEERVIADDAMCSFCCCDEIALFRESRVLERKGYLLIRKLTDSNGKGCRGYTISLPTVRAEK